MSLYFDVAINSGSSSGNIHVNTAWHSSHPLLAVSNTSWYSSHPLLAVQHE